jgi:predicted dehydrogenase
MIRFGICGFGYWGPNLFRNLNAHPDIEVTAVADRSDARREQARRAGKELKLYEDAVEMIDRGDVDAVAVATPVATHFEIAAHALQSGKHVLVEKPLCESARQAQELITLAESKNLALLVDHVYVFHPAVRTLKKLVASKELGTISYFDSLRVNLGLFQPDVNVLWDLAPHDFSILDFLFDEDPAHIEATGYSHVHSDRPDIAFVTAHYKSRMIAHVNLSWMSPVKVRRTAIGGSKQMVVWDDMNNEEKIKIYNSGIELRPEEQRYIHYRVGDIYSPRIQQGEALVGLVQETYRAITGERSSVIDGRHALRVVRMLESAQSALDASLAASRKAMGPLI